MKIEFLPPARAELTDAISYYNTQSEGLGYEFAAEVKRTLERIVQYPDAGSSYQNVPAVAVPTDFRMELFTRLGKRLCLLLR
jgi:hypothetical protein